MIAELEPPVILPPAQPAQSPVSIHELQQTISASRLNLWNQCRMKFFFRYVLRIQKPKSAALFVGSLVHEVLQAWSMQRWKNEIDTTKLQAVFDTGWNKHAGIDLDGEEDKERAGAWNAIECYLAQTPILPTERPEGVEVSLEADLGEHGLPRLIGIIDLIRQGGRIVDFKTTGQTPNPVLVSHIHELQMSCYAVMYRHCTGAQEGGLEIHSIVKTKTPKIVITTLPPMTDKQQTKLFKAMESYLDGLAREDFIPSASFTCAGCEYLSDCRAA